MILGIGLDLCETRRLKRAMARSAFVRRVFSPAEIAACQSRRDGILRYAARFAAKEAYFKAIGTGWGRGVGWLDVEVASDGSGPPRLLVSGEARRLSRALGVKRTHLSLTHTGVYAAAVVVIEGPGPRKHAAKGRSRE
jgi:holo-[acyl-carrier protein] synthase